MNEKVRAMKEAGFPDADIASVEQDDCDSAGTIGMIAWGALSGCRIVRDMGKSGEFDQYLIELDTPFYVGKSIPTFSVTGSVSKQLVDNTQHVIISISNDSNSSFSSSAVAATKSGMVLVKEPLFFRNSPGESLRNVVWAMGYDFKASEDKGNCDCGSAELKEFSVLEEMKELYRKAKRNGDLIVANTILCSIASLTDQR